MSIFHTGSIYRQILEDTGLNIFISVQEHSIQFSIIQTLGLEWKHELNPLYTGNP